MPKYTLHAYRNDHVAAVFTLDTDDPSRDAAEALAARFGLGSFVNQDMQGVYHYTDGEVVTRFSLTE